MRDIALERKVEVEKGGEISKISFIKLGISFECKRESERERDKERGK